MKRYLSGCVLLSSMALFPLAHAADSNAKTSSFDGYVGVSSDYVFRGLSLSGEDPAVQAGMTFAIDRNWYARSSVSEVETSFGGNLEFQFAGGFKDKINKDFNYGAELTYYVFTDEDNGDSDYAELTFNVEYKKFIALTLAHTTDYYGTNDPGTYLEGRFTLPLHDVIKTAVYVGYQSLDDNAGESYSVFGIDAWTQIGEIDFKLSFSDTDLKHNDSADSRIFVTAKYQF